MSKHENRERHDEDRDQLTMLRLRCIQTAHDHIRTVLEATTTVVPAPELIDVSQNPIVAGNQQRVQDMGSRLVQDSLNDVADLSRAAQAAAMPGGGIGGDIYDFPKAS